MTEQNIQQVLDLFGGEFAPEVIEDSEGIDFDKPIKGKYVCRIVELNRFSGQSDKCIDDVNGEGNYDMWSLSLQVVEDVEGENSGNRYLSKTYSNVCNKYQSDADEGAKKLFNDLFTANILKDLTITATDKQEAIKEIADQLVDKTVNVSAYATKSKKQAVRIVNEFKLKKAKAEEATDSDW